MYGHFPEHSQNAQGIQRILTLDWLSRKTLHWPLVPYPLIPHSFSTDPRIARQPSGEVCAAISPKDRPALPSQEDILKQVFESFPPLRTLLSKHHGKLALCGGLLARAAACTPLARADCDLFFYGYEGPATPSVLSEYRTILEDSIGLLASSAPEGKVLLNRSDHAVSVLIHSAGRTEKYQFILRLYPHLDLILGGFDLGPAMIGFDGTKIVTTQLGAWSLGKRCVVVDTTRRSSSYEYRLLKYFQIGYDIVLPGFDERSVEEISPEGIRKKMLSVGLKYCGEYISEHVVPSERFTLNGRICVKEYYPKGKRVKLVRKKPIVPYERKLLPENTERYSDYAPFDPCFLLVGGKEEREEGRVLISKYYTSIMKTGARERMMVVSEVPRDYEEAKKKFAEMIDHPKMELCENVIEQHTQWMNAYRPRTSGRSVNSKMDYRMLAEYYVEWQKLIIHKDWFPKKKHKMFIDKVGEELNRRIIERSKTWVEDFKGLKWRTENPGAQHTASFNPIMEDPRMFYRNCYKSFVIGIPREVEQCVWVILNVRLKWPPEIVKLILRKLVESSCMTCSQYEVNDMKGDGEKRSGSEESRSDQESWSDEESGSDGKKVKRDDGEERSGSEEESGSEENSWSGEREERRRKNSGSGKSNEKRKKKSDESDESEGARSSTERKLKRKRDDDYQKKKRKKHNKQDY